MILESHRYTEIDNVLKDAMGDPDNDVCMYAIETLKQQLEPGSFHRYCKIFKQHK